MAPHTKRSNKPVPFRYPQAQAIQRPAEAAEYVRLSADGGIGIDGRKLPPPSRIYDADMAWPVIRQGVVSLYFGKLDFGPKQAVQLRSRVEVRYPTEAFVYHFWENSLDFAARLEQNVARVATPLGKWAERPDVDPSVMGADKEHSEWANFDVISQAGNQASLDFYLLPPSVLATYNNDRLRTGRGDPSMVHVEPIVRVFMPSVELLHLFEECRPLVAQLKAAVPSPDDEEKP